MSLFDNQTETAESTGAFVYAKCPSCQETFLLATENERVITDARRCKYCDHWIDESKIVLSGLINQSLTESLESAEVIKGFAQTGLFIVSLIFIEIVLVYSVKDPFFHHLAFGFTSLIVFLNFNFCSNWMKKYKDLRIYDRELSEAKKRVRTTRIVWGIGLVVNVIFWISFFVFIKK